jgi:serine/threonine protein kinase
MKSTEEWKLYTEEVYPPNSISLFDEIYVKNNKRNIIIQKHSFCEVIKKENSEKFFLKYVKGDDDVISGYLKEINALKDVVKSKSHANLLNLVDLFDEVNENNERELYLVFNRLTSDFKTYIDSNEVASLTESEILTYCSQLASAVSFLHEREFYFPPESLTATNIYFNHFCSDLLIDIG